jgi:hypothetical protein
MRQHGAGGPVANTVTLFITEPFIIYSSSPMNT